MGSFKYMSLGEATGNGVVFQKITSPFPINGTACSKYLGSISDFIWVTICGLKF